MVVVVVALVDDVTRLCHVIVDSRDLLCCCWGGVFSLSFLSLREVCVFIECLFVVSGYVLSGSHAGMFVWYAFIGGFCKFFVTFLRVLCFCVFFCFKEVFGRKS